MLLTRIFYSVLLIAAGAVSLKYNYQLVGFTGRQDWIERYLGSGSTYFAFKLLSVGLVLGGILYLTGWSDPILRTLFSPLSRVLNPPQTP